MRLFIWGAIVVVAIVIIILGLVIFKNFHIQSLMPHYGDNAPFFELKDQNGEVKRLSDYKDQWLILYFYPKDDSPGCTEEACSFKEIYPVLQIKHHATVVGISIDDEASHYQFIKKHSLPFTLLSDTKGKVARSYGSLWDALIFKFARRNTFLISPKGKIMRTYIGVKPAEHVSEIIHDIKRFEKL